MIIRYAEEKNFIELRQFYDGMCKVLSGKDFLPEGDKGGFPPDEMIKDAIKERNQFIGIEDGRIVAAYIMNHDRDEAYHAAKWLIDARAGMRRLVKRLLKKHKYPPEGMDDAVQTVMSQCEMWTDNVMTA